MKRVFSFYLTNFISTFFGFLANIKSPLPIQKFINELYIKMFKLDMAEFDTPASYKSLNALFIRSLIQKRDFDSCSNTLISPCDSKLFEISKVNSDSELFVKGKKMSAQEILRCDELLEYSFINFYLSPKDYHRFHAPLDLEIKKASYFPGALFPVNSFGIKNIKNLYGKNERIVLHCVTHTNKKLFFVAVGALNVGKIVFHFDTNLSTNCYKEREEEYLYDNLFVKKGDELGYFKMGSTVLLFLEDEVEYSKGVDQSVRFGDSVAKLISN